jgi:hypothetical protein
MKLLSSAVVLSANIFQRILNSLRVCRECENSRGVPIYSEIRAILGLFYLYKLVFKYAKSI